MMTTFANRYEIQSELGQGSFGVVYRAHDMTLDRDVALKVLHPALTMDAATVRLFTREAGTLAKLDHDNIVPVYDMGVSDGARYIVMRHVPGRSLAQVLADEGPQSPYRVAAWLAQIAAGLDYAHSRGVLHRDLKPSNLLLDQERDRVLISDFGLARAVENSGGSSSDQSRHSMTGTVLYMAPEILQGGEATPGSDLYGLGCVLYELLAGTAPYTGDNPMAVMFQHVQADVPALDLPGREGDALAAQVAALMAKGPAQRPVNAQAAVDALTATPVAATDEPLQSDEPAMFSMGEQPTLWTPTPVDVAEVAPLRTPSALPPAAVPERTRRIWPRVLLGFVGLVTLLGSWLMGPYSPLGDEAQPSAMLAAVRTSTPAPTKAPAPIRTPTPSPVTRSYYDMEAVFVPAGTFEMGSQDGESDEQPVHRVDLDAFWIGRTEVTNAQYAHCVAVGPCSVPGGTRWNDPNYADHPVTHVDWRQAMTFAKWYGGSLPTEAQWEKACRGEDEHTYPWGNQEPLGDLTNFGNQVGTTTPVGSYPLDDSPYGAKDMAGNVGEWTADWYGVDYYSLSPLENPTGPGDGYNGSMRGGSWFSTANNTRCANRRLRNPRFSGHDVGFRVAWPAGS